MFRRFSLFDSAPPSARISIHPPRPVSKPERKKPNKHDLINSLASPNITALSPESLLYKTHDKRSKSMDHSQNMRLYHQKAVQQAIIAKQRAKSATLPPIVNHQLPQSSSPTSSRWFSRLGNSFRRGAWIRRTPNGTNKVIK